MAAYDDDFPMRAAELDESGVDALLAGRAHDLPAEWGRCRAHARAVAGAAGLLAAASGAPRPHAGSHDPPAARRGDGLAAAADGAGRPGRRRRRGRRFRWPCRHGRAAFGHPAVRVRHARPRRHLRALAGRPRRVAPSGVVARLGPRRQRRRRLEVHRGFHAGPSGRHALVHGSVVGYRRDRWIRAHERRVLDPRAPLEGTVGLEAVDARCDEPRCDRAPRIEPDRAGTHRGPREQPRNASRHDEPEQLFERQEPEDAREPGDHARRRRSGPAPPRNRDPARWLPGRRGAVATAPRRRRARRIRTPAVRTRTPAAPTRTARAAAGRRPPPATAPRSPTDRARRPAGREVAALNRSA